MERRTGRLRRQLNEAFTDPETGRFSKSEVAVVLGQGLALWWGLAYAADVIQRWDVALVILVALIVPKALFKIVQARTGNGMGYQELETGRGVGRYRYSPELDRSEDGPIGHVRGELEGRRDPDGDVRGKNKSGWTTRAGSGKQAEKGKR